MLAEPLKLDVAVCICRLCTGIRKNYMVDVQVLFKQVIGEDRAAVDTAAAEYALHC